MEGAWWVGAVALAAGGVCFVMFRLLRQVQYDIGLLERLLSMVLPLQQGNLPLPPAHLRRNVGMNGSGANFLTQGAVSSRRVLELFGERPSGAVLDWGCGSGRTWRWLQGYEAWRKQYHGCDVDREAVEWLQGKGVANIALCGDMPPLPYADEMFAAVFSFSVLTHIHPDRHRAWYAELRRILKKGGTAYLTTIGRGQVPRYSLRGTRWKFERRGWAWTVHRGHYKCSAYVSEEFTRRALEGLFLVETYVEAGHSNMDAFLVRRVN